MKPLILTMQAFVPYAARQRIDLRPALDHGLFGIYGATGAGKSTLFTAITYALFGEARGGSALRSHHANDDVLTRVDLIFEVGGRHFRVVREPDQTRPAKRGGGVTTHKHAAWLFDVTGMDLATVSDAAPGKLLAEKKVSTVNARIVEILGYGLQQFQQIVLLPQGRFETFLNAGTNERQQILSELFDVSAYRRLTDHLKQRVAIADQQIKRLRETCESVLSREGFADLGALDEGVLGEAARLQAGELAQTRAKEEAVRAQEAFETAAHNHAAFERHHQAEQAVSALEAQKADDAARRRTLSRARAAAVVEPVANALREAELVLAQAQRQSLDADERARDRLVLHEESERRLTAVLAQRTLVEQQRDEHATCVRFMRLIDESEALAAQARSTAAEAHDRQAAAGQARERLSGLEAQHRESCVALDRARADALLRAELNLALATKETALREARAYESAEARHAAATHEASIAAAADAEAAAALLRADGGVAHIDQALLASHAAHLAAHLSPGEPCAVCGSTHHPAPADARSTAPSQRHHGPGDEVEASATTLAARYQRAKAALNDARRAADEARARKQRCDAVVEEARAALARGPLPEVSAKAIERECRALRERVRACGEAPPVEVLQEATTKLDRKLSEAANALKRAQLEAERASEAASRAEIALQERLAPIPQGLRARSTLEKRLGSLHERIAAFDAALEAGEAARGAAREAVLAADLEAKGARRAVGEATSQVNRRRVAWRSALDESDLSEEQFVASQVSQEEMEALDAATRAFAVALEAARRELATAAAALAQHGRPNMPALEAQRDGARARLEKAQEAQANLRSRYRHLQAMAAQCRALLEDATVQDQRTARLRRLAEAFDGQGKGARVKLETFAIGLMFEHVLEAANLRLGPMTRGRYAFTREGEGASSGGGYRGLEIFVFDSHTGRARAPSTLSGGEKFIAALALALGLSDIVEQSSGRVRLDALFIDEGFGTLDSEDNGGTLEQVLQALPDLVGQGRAIGLISHVPEVQRAVPHGVWITPGAQGSTIEMRL
ncbi:MAG: SMC family ATPase [Pseudomonadota bacterium]